MGNVVLFQHISLDGFASDTEDGLDWVSYDKELEAYAQRLVAATGAALYGRVTYELMQYFRTVLADPNAKGNTLEHAKWIEQIDKIVFSKTLEQPDWRNTTVIRDNIPEEIAKLKRRFDRDLMIFGSPSLGRSLLELDLIDEYRLTLNPVILGGGKSSFTSPLNTRKLRLEGETRLASGVLALHYATRRD